MVILSHILGLALTWRAIEDLYDCGKTNSIGVSNFTKSHLEYLATISTIIQMPNQMEFHPYFVQQEPVDYFVENIIQYEACLSFMQGKLSKLDFVDDLEAKYDKSTDQIVLRGNSTKWLCYNFYNHRKQIELN